MKDKIIAKLKEKYPNINLSKARLDAIADKLKVTEESEIEGKLEELNDIFPFAEVAKQDDRIRGLEKKDQKPADEKKPDNKPEKDDSADDDEGMPKWFKGYASKVDSLVEKVLNIETGNTTKTRKQQLEEALADAPEKFKKLTLKNFELMNFDTDEKFTGFLEGLKTDKAEFAQTETNEVLETQGKPYVPGLDAKSSFVDMMSKIGETATKK
ncbi:hypothetical protein GCM10027592_29480 [Spirosoma flavus]